MNDFLIKLTNIEDSVLELQSKLECLRCDELRCDPPKSYCKFIDCPLKK